MCQRIEFNRRNEAQVLARRGISNGGGEGRERERDGREKEKERNKKTRRERQGRVVKKKTATDLTHAPAKEQRVSER